MTAIKIYGGKNCHKCQYYEIYLSDRNLPYTFLDVTNNEKYAEELRSLYESGKLNFPTLVVNGKKLRNPSDKLLDKWLIKNKTSTNDRK